MFIQQQRILWVVICSVAAAAASYAGVLYDPQVLETHRAAWRNGAPALVSAVDVLLAGADDALSAGPFSVTFKDETPPSGDKRDYMSQGPYWWPNPDTDDGLPYVRRDGERNPEGDRLDRQSMGRMASAATTLALAWFLPAGKIMPVMGRNCCAPGSCRPRPA